MVLGHDRRLFLVPLEQPGALVVGRDDVAPAAGTTDGADAADRHTLLLDALEHAATVTGGDRRELAALVDDALGPEVARDVATRGLTLVVPADDRSEARFAFAHGDGFARHIEDLGPDLTSVRLRWHPDDDPEVKKAQALGLTKLAAWLHETDRRLLIELLAIAPTGPSADAPPASGEDVSRLPETVQEIRQLGIEADVWSVAAPTARDQAEALAEVIVDEGRDDVAAIVRLTDPDLIEPVAAACTGLPAYRGAVLGPALWTPALGGAAGDPDRAQAVRDVGDRIARTIELFAASGPS